MVLAAVMATGGKVLIKDQADFTIKQSTINAIYADHTVSLPDCIHAEYSIFDVTIIRPLK